VFLQHVDAVQFGVCPNLVDLVKDVSRSKFVFWDIRHRGSEPIVGWVERAAGCQVGSLDRWNQ
jgi:hypothetical protein